MIALILATTWSLTFTLPSHYSGLAQPCPLGCRDSSENATPGVQLGSVFVARHRQSPAWLAHGAAMKASADSFSVWWPTVRAEAAWVGYAVIPCSTADSGKPFSVAVADTSHGWWYAVAARDSAGHQACLSNEVWRP